MDVSSNVKPASLLPGLRCSLRFGSENLRITINLPGYGTVMATVLDVQPVAENVTEPDCFLTVIVNDPAAVPLTVREEGLT